MSQADAQKSFELTAFDLARAGKALLQDNQRFQAGLVIALLLHFVLLVGLNHEARQRRLGAPSGAENAISVSIMTEAELKSLSTVDDRAAGQPAPPPTPSLTPPQEPTDSPTPKAPEAETPAVAKEAPAAKPPVPEAEKQPPALKPGVGPEPPQEVEASKAEPEALPDKGAKAEPAPADAAKPAAPQAAKPAAQPKTQQAKPQEKRSATLDLSLPPPTDFAAPSGAGAGVERPPGITRSGENDAFARGVIRALQRTMPQLSDTHGRVTVRIKLDMNGGLVSTEVLRPSQVAGLDQSVVFATQQSSFPFPPRNAVPADLIFNVTYIYR